MLSKATLFTIESNHLKLMGQYLLQILASLHEVIIDHCYRQLK